VKKTLLIVLVLATVFAAIALLRTSEGERASGPMPNDVYVWQRSWSESLNTAIGEHATNFTEFVVLTAEVSWQTGRPRLVKAPVDYPTLLASGRPVGLALRIGPYGGPLGLADDRTQWLASLAASLLAEASTNKLQVAELQIDFDCAESKLDGYRDLVKAIRQRVTPATVTITALPAWLKRPAFKQLIAEADGYVLQVHSLTRPQGANMPFSLCDPADARRAVERAASFGKPFRVALPTYGYVVAFNAQGQFAGLSAEGPAKLWPEGTQLREVRADPNAMADLVALWNASRPQALTGVIWYRLPVPADTLNWSWPTLAAVLRGETPRANLQVQTRRSQTGLIEIDLVNTGETDHVTPVQMKLNWLQARLVAADALHEFELFEDDAGVLQFRSGKKFPRLAAGQHRTIGWVRLDRDVEVQLEIQSGEPQ